MSDSIEEIIQNAIVEAKAGNKEAAKKALSQVVKQDPNNARAWYLLSQVVEKKEQAVYCLERVLKIQPDNQQAKPRLTQLVDNGKETENQQQLIQSSISSFELFPTRKTPDVTLVDYPTKKCPCCGEAVRIDDKICENCGNHLTAEAQGSQAQPSSFQTSMNPIESTTTGRNFPPVGSSTKKCPYCARTINADNRYCSFCGRDLSASQQKKTVKRTKISSVLAIILISLLPIFACCSIGIYLSRIRNVNNVSSASSPTGSIQTESIQNWVIYEVKYVGFGYGLLHRNIADVDITWENNTGGTEQGTYTIGDGQTSTDADGNWTGILQPFRLAYTMRPGDFAYISAQSNKYDNQLICNIYVADETGESCLVHQGIKCGKIALWKTAQCTGEFCICTASGIFGIP